MHRSKLGARRILESGPPSVSTSTMIPNNEMWRPSNPNCDYVRFYNPNDMMHSQSGNMTAPYYSNQPTPTQQQNWPAENVTHYTHAVNESLVGQQQWGSWSGCTTPADSNNIWPNAAVSTSITTAAPTSAALPFTSPTQPHLQQQPPQCDVQAINNFYGDQPTNWATSQSLQVSTASTTGTIHRSFSDTWNWGSSDESPETSSTDPAHSFNQGGIEETRQLPDGQDQNSTRYPGWNSGMQAQSSNSRPPAESLVNNSPAVSNREGSPQQRQSWESGLLSVGSSPATNFQSMVQNGTEVSGVEQESSEKLIDVDSNPGDAQCASNASFLVDDSGMVSAFFQHGSGKSVHDSEDSKDTDKHFLGSHCLVAGDSRFDAASGGVVGEASQPACNRIPYLRADSWISNSSLMTYNRSVTGSQELLSGSFFGDDYPPNLNSLSGLTQAVEDLHLSTHSARHHISRQPLHHPLHQSFPARHQLDIIGDSSEVCESLPIFADRSKIVEAVTTAIQHGRRSSVPDALISANQAMSPISDQSDLQDDSLSCDTSCAEGDEQCIANIEVPPVASSNSPDGCSSPDQYPVNNAPPVFNGSSSSLVAENVEVIDTSLRSTTEYLHASSSSNAQHQPSPVSSGPVWSRENSAFQPLPPRTSTSAPVIQQEIPEEIPTVLISDRPQNIEGSSEGANLETVPDNVERPYDTEDLNEIRSLSWSALHSNFARQRPVVAYGSSSGTALWESPEPTRGFEMVLAPAASAQLPQQSTLVLPPLNNQQDFFDTSQSASPASNVHKPQSVEPRIGHLVGGVSPSVQDLVHVGPKETGDGSGQEDVSAAAPSAAAAALIPLDLSSRTAPQGRSAAEDDISISTRRLQPVVVESSQGRQVPTPSYAASRLGEGDGSRQPPPPPNPSHDVEQERHRRQWSEPRDDYDDRRLRDNYDSRRRHSMDRRDAPDMYNHRRGDYPLDAQSEDGRRQSSRSRDFGRDRDAPYSQYDDPHYSYRPDRERDRSRPSSRSSVQDYDAGMQDRRYYDSRHYPNPDDGRPLRPSSRGGSGYESDQDARTRRRPEYDYYRDPRYSAYYDYYRYSRDPRYNPRSYSNPYYNVNNYNYGYYAELYRDDPRYRAYYESMAKNYYGNYAAGQYAYDGFDRHSVHSGRSSVTDDSQRGINDQFTFQRDSPNGDRVSKPPATEQTTNYSYDDSYYQAAEQSQPVDSFTQGAFEIEPVLSQRLTPAKFSSSHIHGVFSTSGHLVVIPGYNAGTGQQTQVEICEMQNVIGGDSVSKELQSFPGPLIRCDTHKNDVIQFCLQKVRKARSDDTLPDRESCVLIWELLVLLIRQNGVVVGTDIAELLLRDQEVAQSSPSEAIPQENSTENSEVTSPDDGIVITRDLSLLNLKTSGEDQLTKKFREFLLFGHKKDALEWAMKHKLWGHALFLASKMDSRTYAMVMTRFANSLALNDPLQTLYQLMSGRQPAAVTCIADEKWGDWRPHLAMILSNSSPRPELDRRSVVTLGDTLAARGCLHASHFCYLMAQVDFGSYTKKSSKLVLIGANHSLPFNYFATNESIQCTEVYEYVQLLANPQFVLPSLQFYKYVYATRLAEYGQYHEALHYCEVISQTIQRMPTQFCTELVRQVYELASRLKYYDPYYAQEEVGDPEWFRDLGLTLQAFLEGLVQSTYGIPDQSQTDSAAVEQTSSNLDYSGFAVNPSSPLHSTPGQSSQLNDDQHTALLQTQGTNGYGGEYQKPISGFVSGHPAIQHGESSFNSNQTLNEMNGQSVSRNYMEQVSPVSDQHKNSVLGTQPEVSMQRYAYEDVYDAGQSPPVRRSSTDYYGVSTQKNSISSVGNSEFINKQAVPHSDQSFAKTKDHDSLAKPDNSKKFVEKSKAKQGSWLGGIFGRFSLKPKNQMILPDDKNPSILWDCNLGQWVNTNGDGDDEGDNLCPAAPPRDNELPSGDVHSSYKHASFESAGGSTTNHIPVSSASPLSSSSRYKMRHGRGGRQNYVDVLSGNTVPINSSMQSTTTLQQQMPTQFFIPAPVSEGDGSGTVDFVTPSYMDHQTVNSSRIANPGSRGGSPHHLDSESEDSNSQVELSSSVSQQGHQQQQQQQPLMFDPSSLKPLGGAGSSGTPSGASSLHTKLRGRYPR